MCVYICDCVSMCGCMCEHVGVCARACFSVRVHVWRWLDYREIWNGDGIQAEADHIVAVIASFEAPRNRLLLGIHRHRGRHLHHHHTTARAIIITTITIT